MPNFILNINSPDDDLLLANPDIQCCLLNSEIEPKLLKKIIFQLQQAERIVLLFGANACELCNQLSVDGVALDLSKSNNLKQDITYARKQIGKKFLGAIVRNRRHEAMVASENEPDFIIFKIWEQGFEQTLSLAEWYSEFFLLQMAIFPQDDDVDIKRYPADILILTPRQYKIFVAKK